MNASAPVDLTTLGADAVHPPKGHAIYKHPELQSFAAPTLAELPIIVMALQQQVQELSKQIAAITRDFTSHKQMLKQEAMRNERR